MAPRPRLHSIELFAGIGGIALGTETAGCQPVCFVEREAYAAALLAQRMEEGALAPAPIWSDVASFDGRPWRGVVDLIAGGFPCQDISNAGLRAGIQGERSGLWSEYVRIVREVEPRFVFVENVSALLVRGLDVVLSDLASLGFDAEWGVFRASDVGAPHRRERIFILAHASGRDGQRWPARLGRRMRVEVNAPEELATELAHAKHADVQGITWGRRVNAFDAGKGVSQLADAERGGRHRAGLPDVAGEGVPLPRRGGAGVRGGGSLYPFPPGPSDTSGWFDYLDRWPGLEPALRRGAHGLSHRVDRLRALGNAVVPDCATLAWTVLWDRLMTR